MSISRNFLILSASMSIIASATSGCSSSAAKEQADNPFFQEWDTPFEIPPFEQIKPEHYLPAFKEGMDRQRQEIAAIVANPEAPTFDNTIIPLEYSGAFLNRVSGVFFALNESMNTPEMQKVAEEVMPLYTSFNDELMMNDSLFSRVKVIYDSLDSLNLTVPQRRAVEDYYKNFTLNGALLNADQKKELSAINAKLSDLYLKFNRNLLNATNEFTIEVGNEEGLAGLPQSVIDIAADEGVKRGKNGTWIFTLHAPSRLPVLQFAESRNLRRKMWEGYTSLASSGEYNNIPVIEEIVKTRTEKARLLGFPNYASLATAPYMAKTPEAARELLMKIWRPAVERVKTEVADMQAIADAEGNGVTIEPWDYYYYAEKDRVKKYALNENDVRPYFAVDSVKKGIFTMANKLYGLTFTPIPDAPKYHPEVDVYEVKDSAGEHLAVFMTDYFPRDTKRQGAWMDAIVPGMVTPEGKSVRPIIYNVGNLSRPTVDAPALMTIDDVETMFHEFGHALHGMLTRVALPSQVGTSVDRDFVEFPSQIHEHWAFEPELLKEYARHYRTGQVIPDSLVQKLNAASHHNQGFMMTELVGAALLDLAWGELIPNDSTNVAGFEAQVAAELGMPKQLTFRYRSPYFKHIFGDEGYASGYYTYLWAAVLECDGYELFEEKGAFDPASAAAFKHLLESGGSEDPMKLYMDFRGHKPDPAALLRARGLVNK